MNGPLSRLYEHAAIYVLGTFEKQVVYTKYRGTGHGVLWQDTWLNEGKACDLKGVSGHEPRGHRQKS